MENIEKNKEEKKSPIIPWLRRSYFYLLELSRLVQCLIVVILALWEAEAGGSWGQEIKTVRFIATVKWGNLGRYEKRWEANSFSSWATSVVQEGPEKSHPVVHGVGFYGVCRQLIGYWETKRRHFYWLLRNRKYMKLAAIDRQAGLWGSGDWLLGKQREGISIGCWGAGSTWN